MLGKNNIFFKKIGLGIFFVGLVILVVNLLYSYCTEYLEINKVNNFIIRNNSSLNLKEESDIDNYIGVLEVPLINLKRGFYNVGNGNNRVSKGIEVIGGSAMPDIKYSSLILASHSGNSKVSYFNNLYKLYYGDIIYIYYNNSKYIYEVVDIYEREKNGVISITKSSDVTSLFLITCSKTNDKMYLIYVNKLVDVYNYLDNNS